MDISQIGGITPALKPAHLCEAFGIRTAWHCPGDVSPVGAAANVHLDLAMHNFGVQEWGGRSDEERAAFPGMPEVHAGMLTVSGQPGLGVEFDENLAARFPAADVELDWTQPRLPDGTIARP